MLAPFNCSAVCQTNSLPLGRTSPDCCAPFVQDDIDRDLDSTRSRVKNVRDKLTRLSRQSGRSCSYVCLFLTMIGIIIVLLVLMDVLKWV